MVHSKCKLFNIESNLYQSPPVIFGDKTWKTHVFWSYYNPWKRLLFLLVVLRFHQICILFLYTSHMIIYCVFHICFLDSCHPQNTGKQLQGREGSKPLGEKSLTIPYKLYIQKGLNYAFLGVLPWFCDYMMIYSMC